MKDRFLILAMFFAVVGSSSCSDDDIKKGGPVESGSEIKFGAILEPDTKSRTHYGTEANDPAALQWPIYWNYPDNLDQIFIYSPQGLTGRNQAKYTVHPTEENQSTAATITKVGDFGVQAGTADTYDFFGIYPAGCVQGTAENYVISGTLAADQSVTYAGTMAAAADVVPDNFEQGGGDTHAFLTTPDMSGCIMTASNTNVTLSSDEAVKLAFKPFSSVLDVTIKGPETTNTTPNCRVTSIQVVADAPIAGDFSYDFSKDTPAEAFATGKTTSNTIEVSTMSLDKDGNLVGIPMANGNTLRVQAFLLPNPNVTDIKVKVFTSDAQVWTQKLKLYSDDNTPLFRPSEIHKVVLPEINAVESEFNYNHWLAQLDPRIYLSEISLPGSTSSFSQSASGESQLQTLSITDQFNAGVRVFRCHVWLYDEDSPLEDLEVKRPSFGINVNGGSNLMPMVTAVRTLWEEMKKSHPDEFCVLMVADYSTGQYSFEEFYSRFKIITDRMVAAGYLPEEINSETTIGDVKGKVILKLQLNANGNDNGATTDDVLPVVNRPADVGGARTYTGMNDLLSKIQSWSHLDNAKALFNWWTGRNSAALFYTPMNFGNNSIGSFTYTPFTNNENGRGTMTQTSPGLAPEAAKYLIDNAEWRRPRLVNTWVGNCSLTTPPTDFDNTSQLWYIYAADANPSNITTSESLVTQSTNAIRTYYKPNGQTAHNKFFMTYLGGASGDYSRATVTTRLVGAWNTAIDNMNTADGGKIRPLGWVLFNNVPSATARYEDLSDAQKLVRDGIERVISRNNDVDFKLKRKLTVAPPKAAPSGDTQGTRNAGSVF